MRIGRQDPAFSAISTADAESITVRGRDLTGALMGKISFTAFFYLLVTGRLPDDTQLFCLDLLLVAIAEHGLVPSNVAARMTLAAAPEALQGAVAAGLLGAGSVILGAAGEAEGLLDRARAAGDLRALVRGIREEGGRLPGFGHPLHRRGDPRVTAILDALRAWQALGPGAALACDLEAAVRAEWPKPLAMNVSMMIAAVLRDIGFPAGMARAVPILARTASLLAHLAEERTRPIGFRMSAAAAEAVNYDPGTGTGTKED
jgi:citrate synthase